MGEGGKFIRRIIIEFWIFPFPSVSALHMDGNIHEKRDQITFPRNWYSGSFSRVKMLVRKAIWPSFSGIRLESNDWFPFHLLFKQHDLVISALSLFASSFFTFFFPLPFCSGGLRIVVTRNRAIREAVSLCSRKTRSCCFIYLFLSFFFFFFFPFGIEVSVTYARLYFVNVQMKFFEISH